jgi:hypothetical protein
MARQMQFRWLNNGCIFPQLLRQFRESSFQSRPESGVFSRLVLLVANVEVGNFLASMSRSPVIHSEPRQRRRTRVAGSAIVCKGSRGIETSKDVVSIGIRTKHPMQSERGLMV